jgi:hypothetical protein
MEEKIYTKTITLREPIQLKKNGPIYKTLELRKPTNAEIIRMALKGFGDPTGVRAISQLISDVSGVPLPVIEKLGLSQWTEARDFLLSFRKKGE